MPNREFIKHTGLNNCAELYDYDLMFRPKLSRPHFLPDFSQLSLFLILFVFFRSVQQSLRSPQTLGLRHQGCFFYFSSALSKRAARPKRQGSDFSCDTRPSRDKVITLRSLPENGQQYAQLFTRLWSYCTVHPITTGNHQYSVRS